MPSKSSRIQFFLKCIQNILQDNLFFVAHFIFIVVYGNDVRQKANLSNFLFTRASLVAQRVKRPPAMQETRVQSLGQEDPLEKEMAIHSGTLAWRIPWMEEPGSQGSSLVAGGRKEWDTVEQLHSLTHSLLMPAILAPENTLPTAAPPFVSEPHKQTRLSDLGRKAV